MAHLQKDPNSYYKHLVKKSSHLRNPYPFQDISTIYATVSGLEGQWEVWNGTHTVTYSGESFWEGTCFWDWNKSLTHPNLPEKNRHIGVTIFYNLPDEGQEIRVTLEANNWGARLIWKMREDPEGDVPQGYINPCNWNSDIQIPRYMCMYSCDSPECFKCGNTKNAICSIQK